ncbi:patatin-like phospholipase domain-containing protein 2 [Lampetra fluviatilis]
MLTQDSGWNFSFAGCGFLGVYHIGVASCLQQRAPHVVSGATRVYGASAGALTAASLLGGACLGECCADVMELARLARRSTLGPLHPAFHIVKIIRAGLRRVLPEDAHLRAAGRLCISLTRVSDGHNVLVSDFASKEELVQALICSSFVPIYCGIIPPTFRGVRYVDGGISDNVPSYELKTTVTVSPFCGESDICPRDRSPSLLELRLKNTSIQCNLDNIYRLSRALFPPEPQVLSKMCQQGYNDALRFLRENNLLIPNSPSAGLRTPTAEPPTAIVSPCESSTSVPSARELSSPAPSSPAEKILPPPLAQSGGELQSPVPNEASPLWALEEKLWESLPLPIRVALKNACMEKAGVVAYLRSLYPVRLASYLMLPCTLPVESAVSLTVRLLEWLPDVPEDVRWMSQQALSVVRYLCRQASRSLARSCRFVHRRDLRKSASAPALGRRPSLALTSSMADLFCWFRDLGSSQSAITLCGHEFLCTHECCEEEEEERGGRTVSFMTAEEEEEEESSDEED